MICYDGKKNVREASLRCSPLHCPFLLNLPSLAHLLIFSLKMKNLRSSQAKNSFSSAKAASKQLLPVSTHSFVRIF